jgi:hypothetical protein
LGREADEFSYLLSHHGDLLDLSALGAAQRINPERAGKQVRSSSSRILFRRHSEHLFYRAGTNVTKGRRALVRTG